MDWYLTLALILIGFGVVLLVAEFFLPTGGVLVVVGRCGCSPSAVGVILYYGSTMEAVAAVIAAVRRPADRRDVLLYGWQRMSLGRRRSTPRRADATVANAPEAAELEHSRGRYGKTVSPMRPCGHGRVRRPAGGRADRGDDARRRRVGEVRGREAGRVVVRQVDPPADLPTTSTPRRPRPDLTSRGDVVPSRGADPISEAIPLPKGPPRELDRLARPVRPGREGHGQGRQVRHRQVRPGHHLDHRRGHRRR